MSKEKTKMETVRPHDELWPEFLLLWREFEACWEERNLFVTDQIGQMHRLKPSFDHFISWLKEKYHYGE